MSAAIEQRQLNDAFRAFNELSTSLERSYRDLESQVSRLNEELASVRRARLEEHRARERIASRLERLLALLPGGVLVLDADDVVRECNAAAREMLGSPLEGEPWSAVCARAMQRASVFGGEVPLASGRHVSLAQRSLGDEPGRIVLVTDVTEAHLVRELLERNGRLAEMGEMAARLAHQLRTPLTTALLYASRLASPSLPPEQREPLAARTVDRLKHLEQQVADMLAYARGGASGLAPLSLDAVLEDVAQTLAGRLKAGGRLTLRTRAPGLTVLGNRDALAGAVANLVINALDAGGAGAEVLVEASRPQPGIARITVADNGPGVPEALRDRIFEPFFTTRSAGTGLGLAVVRSVAVAHGGCARLEPGAAGATFVIEIPLGDGAAAPAGATEAA
ncbi:MAG: ATP-binding protein [Steroidobacteraceae bacterium]|jgi:two-component system sensor histidine kinase FlrB|nr:ATP-binding protein [Steroidobacteraceae bacterium]